MKDIVICCEDNTHVFQDISFSQVTEYIGYNRWKYTHISVQILLVYRASSQFWVLLASKNTNWRVWFELPVWKAKSLIFSKYSGIHTHIYQLFMG